MENEIKEAAAAAAGGRITLFENNVLTNDPCAICGARCDPNGFDYGIDKRLVCDQCAYQDAPEMMRIRTEAMSYAKRESEAAVENLIERIKQTISEPLEARIMRTIDELKGEDVPF